MKKRAKKKKDAAAAAKPRDLEPYRSRCERFLGGHGSRSARELLAAIPADVSMDRYGAGGVVEALEREICAILGKPAAVFMASGTMAQQAALCIAEIRGVFTWPQSAPGPTPSHRTVELSIGDATLAFKSQEAADIIAELVR